MRAETLRGGQHIEAVWTTYAVALFNDLAKLAVIHTGHWHRSVKVDEPQLTQNQIANRFTSPSLSSPVR